MKNNPGKILMLLCLIALAALLGCCGCNNTATSNAPVISSVANAQGTTTLSSGATLTIIGTGFGTTRLSNEYGKSYVVFVPQNSLAAYPVGTVFRAPSYVSWSDTTIQCTVPDLAASNYQVSIVIARDGEIYSSTLVASTQNTIKVTGQSSSGPAIASITPLTVNAGGALTISGSLFGSTQGTGYVRFGLPDGGTTQSTVTSWADTEVVCAVPAGVAPGSVPVYVVTGTSTESGSFTITVLSATAPLISALSPSSVAVGSTSAITISGNNFGESMGAGNVSFQAGTGTPVAVTTGITWTSTQVITAIPSSVTAAATTVTVTLQSGTGEISNGSPLMVGTPTGKVYAIFVGINRYTSSGILPLEWCVNDVTGMKDALTASTAWSGAEVVTMTDSQATRSAIQGAISAMTSKITAGDTFFFFYSGHGTNESGHSYLIPVDSTLTTASMIQDDEFNGWLALMNSGAKKCIIFDSCYSGGFVGKKNNVNSRFVKLPGSDPSYNGSFLTRNMSALTSMVFLAASTGGQQSVEDSSLQHGVFTYYLMQGLGSGTTIGPAAAGGTAVTAQQLFTYASPLTSTFNSSQTPQMQDNYTAGLLLKK